jgi:hypothetical protein
VSPLRVTFAVAIAASSSVSAAAEGRGPGAAALSTDAKDKMSLLEVSEHDLFPYISTFLYCMML